MHFSGKHRFTGKVALRIKKPDLKSGFLQMAESIGLEPMHPNRDDRLAICCITTLPTLRKFGFICIISFPPRQYLFYFFIHKSTFAVCKKQSLLTINIQKFYIFLQKQIIKYIIYENTKIIYCADTCSGSCLLFLFILLSGLHTALAQILLLYCRRFGQFRACCPAPELCNERPSAISKTSIRKNRMDKQYHVPQQHYTCRVHTV